MPIGMRTSIGDRQHRVALSGSGEPVPDGEGGWLPGPSAIEPPWWTCSIENATVRELERSTQGTATTRATHVLKGPYHAGITTGTTITFEGRTFYVNGVINVNERDAETWAFCEEQVPQ